MRKTLLCQWEELETIEKKKCQVVVENYLKRHELPKTMYVVNGYKSIDACIVLDICINGLKVNNRKPWLRSNKKPTKKDIDALSKYVSEFNPNETHLAIQYEQEHSYGKSIQMIIISDIIPEKGMSFNRDDLLPILARNKELYEPREGYVMCQYCRQQRLPQDIMQGTIVSPNWKDMGYKSPLRNYCKDKPCHGYDQMAHEG